MSDSETAAVTQPPVKKEKKEKKDKKEKKEKKSKSDKKEKKVKAEREEHPVEESPKVEAETTEVPSITLTEPTAQEATITKPDTETTVDEDEPKKRKRTEKEDEDDEGKLEIDVDAPTPLSKAQARAEKKKAKRVKSGKGEDDEDAAVEGDAGDSERPKKKAKKEKKEGEAPKRKHSIWIGNLSFKANPQSLKTWFERQLGGGDDVKMDVSKEENVTRVNLPMKEGRNRWGHTECKGFAYVDFATPELQQKALALSERLLDGRKVLIKLGDDFTASADARTPKPLSVPAGAIPKNQLHKESSSLFMGNLPFDATEDEIRSFVEDNVKAHTKEMRGEGGEEGEKEEGGSDDSDSESDDDEEEDEKDDAETADQGPNRATFPQSKIGLKKVRMPTFEDSGKCKGFAFIDFNSPKEATYALSVRANRFFRGSRKLNLQYASESSTKRSMSKNKRLGIEDAPPVRRPARYFDAAATAESKAVPGDVGGSGGEKATTDVRGKKWETSGRPRPGAALALAKRENVSIVESQGKKIVF